MDAMILKAQTTTQKRTYDVEQKIDRILAISQVALFAFGIAAPVAGLVLSVIHAAFPRIAGIGGAATILCISTIPLLLLGSHLMDVIDRRRQRRLEQKKAEEVY